MSNSQIILTLGALTLFMFTAMIVNRNYLIAVEQAGDHQIDLDAVNFGLTITEDLYMAQYDSLNSFFGHLDDVNDPARRLAYETLTNDSLYATIDFEDKELPHDINGTVATVSVFTVWNGDYRLEVQVPAALTDL